MDCLRKTVAGGGPRALYQGFGVSVQVQKEILQNSETFHACMALAAVAFNCLDCCATC